MLMSLAMVRLRLLLCAYRVVVVCVVLMMRWKEEKREKNDSQNTKMMSLFSNEKARTYDHWWSIKIMNWVNERIVYSHVCMPVCWVVLSCYCCRDPKNKAKMNERQYVPVYLLLLLYDVVRSKSCYTVELSTIFFSLLLPLLFCISFFSTCKCWIQTTSHTRTLALVFTRSPFFYSRRLFFSYYRFEM